MFIIFVSALFLKNTAYAIQGDPFADDNSFSSSFDEISEPEDSKEKNGSRPFQTELHGYLESRNRLRTGDGKWLSTRQRIWLELDSTLNPSGNNKTAYTFFASTALDIDPLAADLSDDHDSLRLHMEELFFTIDRPLWHITLGRKIHRMGKSDGINPMDLINPLNHRDPVANARSNSRLPTPLVLAKFQLPNFDGIQESFLEIIYIPLAAVNTINALGSVWESPGLALLRQMDKDNDIILEAQDEPDQYLDDSEFGFRLAATFSGWDMGLIGFSGYQDSAVFSISNTIVQNVQKRVFTPVHPKFYGIGLTFAKGFERSTLRGELCIKPDLPLTLKDSETGLGFARCFVTQGVVGIDRTFSVNFYTNAQYFFTHTDDVHMTVNDSFSHGITYEVHDKFLNDALKTGVRGIVSFSDQGLTFEAFAEYKPLDDWLFSVSALFFEGPETGDYGMFDQNDAVTLRLRYSF